MIAVAAQKHHASSHHLFGINVRDLEAENVSVKLGGALEIGDLQHHMADLGDVELHTSGRRHAFEFRYVDGHGFHFLILNENCYNMSIPLLHLRVRNRPGRRLAGAWRVAAWSEET